MNNEERKGFSSFLLANRNDPQKVGVQSNQRIVIALDSCLEATR